MDKEAGRSIKVGIFVIAGTILLIAAIYFIGSKRNIFGSNIYITAVFQDVTGLQKGNNVRFAGINVGTVHDILILNDSSIVVVMAIENEVQRFIKKDAEASIGTDGLMGNRLINIDIGSTGSPSVSDGERIQSIEPIQVDEMLRVLGSTNQMVNEIAGDIKELSEAVSTSRGTLWKLLSDTITSSKLDKILDNLDMTTSQAARMGSNLNAITSDIRNGKGSLGKLVADTAFERKMENSLNNLEAAMNETKMLTEHLSSVSEKIKNGEGGLGVITSDSAAAKLKQSLDNIEQGTQKFNENMEALRHNFLFRRFFRKKKEND